MNTAALLITAISLSGCTTLLETGKQVEGWPALAVTEHRVGWGEALSRCSKYSQWWTWPPVACSEFDLKAKTAVIWCATDAGCAAERRYMAGKEHPTDTVMPDAVKAMR